MGAHVVFCGPSTAGKSSLMSELAHSPEGDYAFTIDRTWTTRARRPSESEEENIFVDPGTFEEHRAHFLFCFSSLTSYEYGIEAPKPLEENEIRMRILRPMHIRLFRKYVSQPVISCSIAPFSTDPRAIFLARDPEVNPLDLEERLARYHQDCIEAENESDIRFQNREGLAFAAQSLRGVLLSRIQLRDGCLGVQACD